MSMQPKPWMKCPIWKSTQATDIILTLTVNVAKTLLSLEKNDIIGKIFLEGETETILLREQADEIHFVHMDWKFSLKDTSLYRRKWRRTFQAYLKW